MTWGIVLLLAFYGGLTAVFTGLQPWAPDLLVVFVIAGVLHRNRSISWVMIAVAGLAVGLFTAEPWATRAVVALVAGLLASQLRRMSGVQNQNNLGFLCAVVIVGTYVFDVCWRSLTTSWAATPSSLGDMSICILVTSIVAPFFVRRFADNRY